MTSAVSMENFPGDTLSFLASSGRQRGQLLPELQISVLCIISTLIIVVKHHANEWGISGVHGAKPERKTCFWQPLCISSAQSVCNRFIPPAMFILLIKVHLKLKPCFCSFRITQKKVTNFMKGLSSFKLHFLY